MPGKVWSIQCLWEAVWGGFRVVVGEAGGAAPPV
jgi:hypothetical protein